MKKAVLFLAVSAVLVAAYGQGENQGTENDEWAIDADLHTKAIFDMVERDPGLEGGLAIFCSTAKWWIELPQKETQDEFLRNAQDLYNGYMLVNTVVADYEIWERANDIGLLDSVPFLDTLVMAIRNVDVDVLQSPELQSKGAEFVKNMVWCMEHPKRWSDRRCPINYIASFRDYIHNRYASVVEDMDSMMTAYDSIESIMAEYKPVQVWLANFEEYARFGAQMDLICHTESFTEQCAIALACCGSVDTYHGVQTLWQLKSMMTWGLYSPLLFDMWVRWRAFCQSEVFGDFWNSYIPNDAYDAVRKIIFTTMVDHISETPDDMLAKNLAMMLAETQGLIRNGSGVIFNNAKHDIMIYCPEFYGERYDVPAEESEDDVWE